MNPQDEIKKPRAVIKAKGNKKKSAEADPTPAHAPEDLPEGSHQATVIDLESGLTSEEIQAAMESEFGPDINADTKETSGLEASGIESTDGVVIEPASESAAGSEYESADEAQGEPLATLGSQQELGLNAQALAELQNSSTETGESAFIEETLPRDLSQVQAKSIIESILFASHNPVSFASLKSVFHGTNINSETLWDILNLLQTDFAGGERGINLEEVAGGYQLRTKLDNAGWLKKLVKARPFRLSGPALEVLSIVAYKQPVIKSEIDDIRGVESGHLVRALMEKHLVRFAGKSELPGKPMLYATTKNFLELFGLRNIRELPTLSEIDKLIPEGIGEGTDIGEKETLSSLSDKIAIEPGKSYSESESELLSITDAITEISTTTEFFEQEKIRERDRRDQERAQDLRERKIIGDTLSDADSKWLNKFEAKIEQLAAAEAKKKAQGEAAAAATAANMADVLEVVGDLDPTDGTEEDLDAAVETLPISESDEGLISDEFAATDLEIQAAEVIDAEVESQVEANSQGKSGESIEPEAEAGSVQAAQANESAARVSAATKAAEEGLAAFMNDESGDESGETNH